MRVSVGRLFRCSCRWDSRAGRVGIATHAAKDGWRVGKEFLCCLPGKTADFVPLYCGSGR